MQRVLILIVSLFISFNIYAQQSQHQDLNHQGFTFGLGVGIGSLNLSDVEENKVLLATTLPNLRFGYFLNHQFAIQLLLPGSIYKKDETTRGFEAALISGQYWMTKKWWVMAGIGLTIDAPVFWSVDPDNVEFNFGIPAATLAVGHELWNSNRFAIDIQYRYFYGQAKLENELKRTGMSNMIILGFNWH